MRNMFAFKLVKHPHSLALAGFLSTEITQTYEWHHTTFPNFVG